MPVNPGVWGIDIGQCALKALRLEMINGAVTATAFDYVEHPKILSQPDANPDELTREALEKFLSRNPTKGDFVAMSVPGQSGLARFVKLPPVEEKKIVDIVKFEAKQQIPFPLDEVVWDYQKVSEGTVTDGFAMDTEIGLFAMKRDMINRFIGHFQAVKLEVHFVQMAPLALANFVTYELLKRGGPDGEAPQPQTVGKKKCVVALDIGTDGSNLIITDGGRIIWQRPIPVGGNHFTRALTKELKLTFAKAEHLKRNAAKSPELANILKALRPVLQEFVGEVQRSLGYFTNTHRDAQVEYMVGLGSAFKLPGLQKYLADKLNLEVRKPDKYARIAGEAVTDAPVFKENVLSFPVAYGLAAQGLGVARLVTNLLPPEISFERKIRAKKPYAVAAAAALLLGTTVLAYGYSVPLADVTDKKIETAIAKAKGVVNEAKSLDGKINEKKTEIDKTQTDVESIIAGQAERNNWLQVNRFVNDCVPMPGPNGNMRANDFLQSFWSTPQGLRALEKFNQRLAKGIDPLEAFKEDDYREHLAMVDIEAVYSRFTPNLKGVYEELERREKKEIGRPRSFLGSYLAPTEWWESKAERPVPPAPKDESIREELKPDGEGWVFEIRGSTYWHPDDNKSTAQFVLETLVRNLVERSRPLPEPKTDEEKKKVADAIDAAIRGKISHVFLYNVWTDKNPTPGSFRWIRHSMIDSILGVGSSAGQFGGGGPGFGEAEGGPGGMAFGKPGGGAPMPGSPSGGGEAGGALTAGAWSPLTGAGGGASGGGRMAFGEGGGPGLGGPGFGGPGFGGPGFRGGGGPGEPGGPGGLVPLAPPTAPGAPGGPGGPGLTMPAPGAPGFGEGGPPAASVAPPKGVKVKPRYEFVIIFAWKEPIPSDKLRPIKVAEAPAATGGYGPGGGGFGPQGPAAGGPSASGPGEGGGLSAGTKLPD